jgi:hypothetical protein
VLSCLETVWKRVRETTLGTGLLISCTGPRKLDSEVCSCDLQGLSCILKGLESDPIRNQESDPNRNQKPKTHTTPKPTNPKTNENQTLYRFSIVLRDISASDELVSSSCTSLSQNGFINYYGKQRFGSTAIGTHAIGLAMLKRYPQPSTLNPKPSALSPQP